MKADFAKQSNGRQLVAEKVANAVITVVGSLGLIFVVSLFLVKLVGG